MDWVEAIFILMVVLAFCALIIVPVFWGFFADVSDDDDDGDTDDDLFLSYDAMPATPEGEIKKILSRFNQCDQILECKEFIGTSWQVHVSACLGIGQSYEAFYMPKTGKAYIVVIDENDIPTLSEYGYK